MSDFVIGRRAAGHALPLALGLAHGAADAAAGFLLGSLPRSLPLAEVALLVVVYNALAFGAQPVFGHLADRAGRPREAALAGLSLLAASLFVFRLDAAAGVAVAGIGSALFHVGGGALALCSTRGRATGPALFAAPGVVGLAAGGASGFAGLDLAVPLAAALACLCLSLRAFSLPRLPYAEAGAEPTLDGRELVLLSLVAAVGLRSAVWTGAQYLFEGRFGLLLALALAAAAGKLAGGALAESFGWRRWTVGATATASALFLLGGRNFAALVAGVALLQSATPATVAAVGRLFPRRPATAAGFSLGLAIALGGFFIFGGLFPAPAGALVPPAALALAALCLWLALREPKDVDRESADAGVRPALTFQD